MAAAADVVPGTKLFIGGLSWSTDDETLADAFRPFGTVQSARVVLDRETGRSRGFGFVVFLDPESANRAIAGMQGQELDGRQIRVDLASEGGGRGGRDTRGAGGGRDYGRGFERRGPYSGGPRGGGGGGGGGGRGGYYGGGRGGGYGGGRNDRGYTAARDDRGYGGGGYDRRRDEY